MIRRKSVGVTRVTERLNEGSFTGSKGIYNEATPISRDTLDSMCNFDISSDGSLTLRKPLILFSKNYLRPNLKRIEYLYNDFKLLIYDDGIEIIEPSKFVGDNNSNPHTLSIIIRDNSTLQVLHEHNTVNEEIVGLDFTNIEIINTFNSTILSNLKMDTSKSPYNRYADPNVSSANILYRYCKITIKDRNTAYLDIVTPEINHLNKDSEIPLNPNMSLDYPYALRDNYLAKYTSVQGVLAYTFCKDNIPFSSNLNNNISVKELTESNKSESYKIISSIREDFKNPIILKAFCNLKKEANSELYCVWETTSDGKTWEEIPIFTEGIPENEILTIAIKETTEETLESSVPVYKYVKYRKFKYTDENDLVKKRPDCLILEDISTAKYATYRFTIRKYVPNKETDTSVSVTSLQIDGNYVPYNNLVETKYVEKSLKYNEIFNRNVSIEISLNKPEAHKGSIFELYAYYQTCTYEGGKYVPKLNTAKLSSAEYTSGNKVILSNIGYQSVLMDNLRKSIPTKFVVYRNGYRLFTVTSVLYVQLLKPSDTVELYYRMPGQLSCNFGKDNNSQSISYAEVGDKVVIKNNWSSTTNSAFRIAKPFKDDSYYKYLPNSANLEKIDLNSYSIYHYNFLNTKESENTTFNSNLDKSNQVILATISNLNIVKLLEKYGIRYSIGNKTYLDELRVKLLNKSLSLGIYAETQLIDDSYPNLNIENKARILLIDLTHNSLLNSYYDVYDAIYREETNGTIGEYTALDIPPSNLKTFDFYNTSSITNIIIGPVTIYNKDFFSRYLIYSSELNNIVTFTEYEINHNTLTDSNNPNSVFSTTVYPHYTDFDPTLNVKIPTKVNSSYVSNNITLTLGNFEYFISIQDKNEILKTELGNSTLGNKLYYKKSIYSYGIEEFKNNILVSDTDSFITPLFNIIDLESNSNNIINVLISWRDYLISATDDNLYLISRNSQGFFSKIINTFIGIPKQDRKTCKAILNGIIFKSGLKLFIIEPNPYSTNETILNITEITKPVKNLISETKYDPFAFTTEEAYYLFLPYENYTTCVKYEYARKIWTFYKYPVTLIDYKINNVESITLLGLNGYEYYFEKELEEVISPPIKYDPELIPYCDYIDHYPTELIDHLEISVNLPPHINTQKFVPIEFFLDTGQKTTEINSPKQFVETKIMLGTIENRDFIDMKLDIQIDGMPYKTTIDANTDSTIWKNQLSDVGTLNTIFNTTGQSNYNLLKQGIFRYSGKGKSIRHIIHGSSKYKFKVFATYYRYKNLRIKK